MHCMTHQGIDKPNFQRQPSVGPSDSQPSVLELEPEPEHIDIDSHIEPMFIETNDRPPSPIPSPPTPVTFTGRPQRSRLAPLRFRDVCPEPVAPVPPAIPNPEPPVNPQVRSVRLIVRDTVRTAANIFGLWREYLHRPSYEPDAFMRPEDLMNHDDSGTSDIPNPDSLLASETRASGSTSSFPPPWPFTSMTRFSLMKWVNNGHTQKSEAEVDKLVNDVLLSPHFNQEDLKGFKSHAENARMDAAASGGENPLLQAFKQTGISIDVPSGSSTSPSRPFIVPGLLYRKITDVIRSAFAQPLAHQFHFSPFHLFHSSSDTDEPTRVYSELYNSDAFIKVYDDVKLRGKIHPSEAGCTLEKVVAALMCFSDATHLAQFGNAKAWPIYLVLGNLSKYLRARPSSGAMHHLAYVPSVQSYNFLNPHPANIALAAARFLSRLRKQLSQ